MMMIGSRRERRIKPSKHWSHEMNEPAALKKSTGLIGR
jgi:hypothetical protein